MLEARALNKSMPMKPCPVLPGNSQYFCLSLPLRPCLRCAIKAIMLPLHNTTAPGTKKLEKNRIHRAGGERENFREIKERPTDKKVPLVEGGRSRWVFSVLRPTGAEAQYSTLQHCGQSFSLELIILVFSHPLADQFFTLTHQCELKWQLYLCNVREHLRREILSCSELD